MLKVIGFLTAHYRLKKVMQFFVLLVCVLNIGQAIAIRQATTSDNDALKIQLNTLTSSSLSSMLVGLAPFWQISIPASIASFGTELGVRYTPAVFQPPADIFDYANLGLSDSGHYCQYNVAVEANTVADTAYFYFIRNDTLWTDSVSSFVFGNLGMPDVYHPHAAVKISVDNPEFFNIGKYQLNWKAETLVNPITEIALPTALLVNSAYSAKKSEEKAIAKQVSALLDKLKAQGKESTPFAIKNAENLARRAIIQKKALVKLATLVKKLGIFTIENNADDYSLEELQEIFDAIKITSAINSATQNITIWDQNPPFFQDPISSSRIVEQHVTLEATDFGGVRLGRVTGTLQNEFDAIDVCDRPISLALNEDSSTLLKIGETTPVTWIANDDGPYEWDQTLADNQSLLGENVYTELVQYITVEDTQPPLLLPPSGFAIESDSAIDLTSQIFPLGRPKIVDLADPRPEFSYTSPDILEVDHRYAITWQAQDASGNVTQASQENPNQYTQFVTIKSIGSNTPPLASAASASSKTAKAVEILLSGQDNDVIDGRVDPLDFKIEDYPLHGEFEAPLLPFFIEDYRLSPVGDHEKVEDNEIVRTNPLGPIADDFRLADAAGRKSLLNTHYCYTTSSRNYSLHIPIDFVYNPTYVHVDDDGFSYVRDSYWACSNFTATLYPRISKWDTNNNLAAISDLKSLLGANATLDKDFSVDSLGWIWFSLLERDAKNNITASRLYGMNSQFEFFNSYGEVTTDAHVMGDYDKLQDMAVNTDDQVFYELRGFGFRVKALDDSYEASRQLELDGYLNNVAALETVDRTYDSSRSVYVSAFQSNNLPMAKRDGFTSLPGQCLEVTGDEPLYTYFQNGSLYRHIYELKESCPIATDIEVDSAGYVYIAQKDLHRILKYSPAFQDVNDHWQVGEFMGWMGDCTVNKQNNEGVFYNACDEDLGISRGYTCSDDKCEQANSKPNSTYSDILYTSFSGATQPGAFRFPASIKMGPRDILYVADTGNSRVQRFGSDGAFAGEARSTGTGINQGDNGGFMLGNFGKPYSLSVNSSAFYVINRDDENGDNFLHVFKTLPFYDVTDSSAKIKYVSDFNFQGNDSFSYFVDDGIDSSDAATVAVNVSRSFRPPEKLTSQCFDSFTSISAMTDAVPCVLEEDSELYIKVTSKDADGFISTGDGGLDQHTFSVTDAPQNGQLTALETTDNAAVYSYQPSADFNGSDRMKLNAFDGVDNADESVAVNIVITPTPDPVNVKLPGYIKAARGFRHLVKAEFNDVDENYQPELLSLKWGDGSQAIPANWVNSGRMDDNGHEISPQIDFTPDTNPVSSTGGRAGTGNGMIFGSHSYAEVGHHSLELRLMNHDNDGEPNLQTVIISDIEVIEATLISAVMETPTQAVNPETEFVIELLVTNEIPNNWSGLIARNVTAKIEFPEGMSITAMDSNCSGSTALECQLGDLGVGETKHINVMAKISLAEALNTLLFGVDISIVDDGPHIYEANVTSVQIHIADSDEDAVADVVDAFPNDPRYADDVDADHIADEWELANGLNALDASDAAQDPDADGVSNLSEFLIGTQPFLAEATEPSQAFKIDVDGDHRLGYSVASGDINGDGYSDVVAGAPGYQGQGAIVIYYGAADGVNALAPLSIEGTEEFGRVVAVGDLNNDLYADIAVTSTQGVYLFMGSETSLGTPILIQQPNFSVEQPISSLFGQSLLIADIDNDDKADLIIGDPDQRGGFEYSKVVGAVWVYRAVDQYWLDVNPVRSKLLSIGFKSNSGTTIDQHRLGDSLAVGDINGDSIPDLMVGAAFSDPISKFDSYSSGVVAGFLGDMIDWSHVYRGTQNFILFGESPFDRFGYSLASGEDIDGDGKDDLMVGAYAHNATGAAYVYLSGDEFWNNPSIDNAKKFQGNQAGGQFAISVDLAPLTAYSNNVALIMGSNRAQRDVGFDEGRVDFYSLDEVEPWLSLYGDSHDMFGYAVTNAGDINNDGEPDYVIGAPDNSIDGHIGEGGQVQIFLARSGQAQVDSDGDFVANSVDNCTNTPNTDQFDADNDGVGNECDDTPNGDISDNTGTGTGADIGTGSGSSKSGGGVFGYLLLWLMLSLLLMLQFNSKREKNLNTQI